MATTLLHSPKVWKIGIRWPLSLWRTIPSLRMIYPVISAIWMGQTKEESARFFGWLFSHSASFQFWLRCSASRLAFNLLLESLKIHDVFNRPTGCLNDGTPNKVDVVVRAKIGSAECGENPALCCGERVLVYTAPLGMVRIPCQPSHHIPQRHMDCCKRHRDQSRSPNAAPVLDVQEEVNAIVPFEERNAVGLVVHSTVLLTELWKVKSRS